MSTTGLHDPNHSEPISSGNQPDAPKVPRMVWYGLVAILLLAIAGLVVWRMRPPELHGVVLQSPSRVSDFTLTSSTGDPISLSDLRGKHVMLYFGYTFCPDVCPTTLADLRMMAQELGEEQMKEVQVVMISVDPERDSPERLAQYMSFFDPSFMGMTGPLDEIDAAATQFGVYYEHNKVDGASEYLVDHTSTVTLIDADGYVRMVFPYGTPGEDMAADLRYMMRR
jgi:protein SCO1/2